MIYFSINCDLMVHIYTLIILLLRINFQVIKLLVFYCFKYNNNNYYVCVCIIIKSYCVIESLTTLSGCYV